jgi:hypothetical protein
MSRIPSLAMLAAAGMVAVACHHADPVVAAPPPLPAQRLAPPPAPSPSLEAIRDTANEMHVNIDTHGKEVDVRSVLDYIGSVGNFKLVYGADVNKKLRVRLIGVPVSVALEAVLSAAELTLEKAATSDVRPGASAVVFYQLPVNVDSLSVESIMKRFGVGRTVAELIVQSRTYRP